MSTTEYRTQISTVRIHDDMCVNAPERWAEQLSFIVSESYKRRSGERIVFQAGAVRVLGACLPGYAPIIWSWPQP